MAKTKISDDTFPILMRVWRDWMRHYTPQIAVILLLVVIIAGTTSLYPVLIKTAFDGFAQAGAGAAEAAVQGASDATPVVRRIADFLSGLFGREIGLINTVSFLVLVVTAIKGFSLLAQTILTNRIVTQVEADMQSTLYAHLIDADMAQLARESPASLTQRFTTDFSFIKEALTRLVNVFVRDMVTAVALVGAMMWIDWKLTLIALVVAPIIAQPINRIGRKLRRVATSTQEQTGTMASLVSESLAGARVAKTYGLEGYLKERASRAFNEVRALKMKSANARGRLDPLLEVGGGVAVAGVLAVIGLRIANGQSSIGDFTGFVTALLLAAQPLRSVGNLNAIIQEAVAALKRVFAVIDEKPTIVDRPGAKSLVVRDGKIAFEGLRFRYRDDAAALEGVDLVVPGGLTTALVGRSGSGKSTLMSLVPRLYDPTGGRVLVDGQDLREVTLASLREKVAVVSQDVVLFDDTIRANIAFGRPGASEEEIVAAAKAAAAHDFILRLPEGYDTKVGDRGGRLSGGERQRVVLARAFLKDAPILLLDEATSALDAESEQLVQAALAVLMKNRTTLVIAHRLSTIRHADQIVVMDHGRVAEIGRHDGLMAKDGLYAKLHQIQFAVGAVPDDAAEPA